MKELRNSITSDCIVDEDKTLHLKSKSSRVKRVKKSGSGIRMSDVAAELGLSRVTVSAVLNDRYRKCGISEETAARVHAAARQMGYYRNDLAMAMKSGRNQVIGAIVSNLPNGWVGMILSGILQGSRKSNYLIKVEEVSGEDEEVEAFSRLMGQRVAGIVCCNFNPGDEFIRKLGEAAVDSNLSVVSTSTDPRIVGWHVDSDDYNGSIRAVEHLWDLGHSRIAYIDGPENIEATRARREGFIEGYKAKTNGAQPEIINCLEVNSNDAEVVAAQLLNRQRVRPTAVLCMNEWIAAQVLRVANRLGLSVPEDLSIITYAGSTLPLFTDPALTTIEQPFRDIGRETFNHLLNAIEKKLPLPNFRTKGRQILLPLELVERGSTCAPSAS